MRVLLVVHGFPPAAGGGTEHYVRDLARALASTGHDEVFVLTRDADPRRPELSLRQSTDEGISVLAINNTFQACADFEDSYANPALCAVAATALDDIQPDVVHVQHLTCLSTGILEAVAARGIPLVVTLNDYWMICHRGQLFDMDGRRCDGPVGEGCARCVPAGVLAGPAAYRAGRLARALPLPGVAAVSRLAVKGLEAFTPERHVRAATLARLRHMQAAARHVDLFLAPSATMEARFEAFGLAKPRLLRCNQGINLTPYRGVAPRTPSAVLRIAFAGGLIPSKGASLLLEAVAQLPAGSAVVDVLGAAGAYHGDHDYAEMMGPLLQAPFIRRLGPVPHDRMAAALADADVVAVPSVWIENAPFIIREAFAARAPVVASDLGGMAEMVRHDVNGLLFPPGDVSALTSQLRRLLDDPSLLERLRAGIQPPLAIEDDAAALRAHYERLGRRRSSQTLKGAQPRRASALSVEGPPARPRVTAIVLNYRTPEQTWLAVGSLQASFTPPSRVIVVDNGSGDGSDAALQRMLPGVEVLAAGANLGFSGGSNVGIRRALDGGADFVLLVNSDAVLAPDAIDRLLAAAAVDEGIGILAPVLLSREEPDHIASAGISFSTRSGRMRHRAAGLPVSLLEPVAVAPVDALSGCVMLIRREVFDRTGLLDDDYFFSFEDIDFCLRARAEGFGVMCVQGAIAYHEGGRSIGRRSARRVYFATRNHLKLSAMAGPSRGRRLRGAGIVGLNAAYVLVAPEAPLFSGLAAVARGTWHHLIGRYGPD